MEQEPEPQNDGQDPPRTRRSCNTSHSRPVIFSTGSHGTSDGEDKNGDGDGDGDGDDEDEDADDDDDNRDACDTKGLGSKAAKTRVSSSAVSNVGSMFNPWNGPGACGVNAKKPHVENPTAPQERRVPNPHHDDGVDEDDTSPCIPPVKKNERQLPSGQHNQKLLCVWWGPRWLVR